FSTRITRIHPQKKKLMGKVYELMRQIIDDAEEALGVDNLETDLLDKLNGNSLAGYLFGLAQCISTLKRNWGQSGPTRLPDATGSKESRRTFQKWELLFSEI
ncbi:12962_t:CDS:2, partial [Ambispora leptoticha]